MTDDIVKYIVDSVIESSTINSGNGPVLDDMVLGDIEDYLESGYGDFKDMIAGFCDIDSIAYRVIEQLFDYYGIDGSRYGL